MKHYSRTEITDFVYDELDKTTTKEMKVHIDSCKECNVLYNEIFSINESLNSLETFEPADNSFQLIMDQIDEKEKRFNWQLPSIVLSVLFVFSILYISNESLLSLPIINELDKFDLFSSVSNFTKSLLLFFGIGSLITLAITPVLVKENQLHEVITL